MSKISIIQFRYLRGETHYQYLDLFDQLLLEFPDAQQTASPFYNEFTSRLAQEQQIVTFNIAK